jgi:putative ABC transport system substrate-binding protein
MNRRDAVLALLALGAAPFAALAEQAGKVYRIGWLADTSSSSTLELNALREGLRELGYIEGRNIAIEARWGDGDNAALPELARSLVELKVDVICTTGTPGALAAKQATSTIPIIFGSVGFPDKTGLVASLARPGGNATGSAFIGPEYGKRLEFMREVSPRLARVALLYNDKNRGSIFALQETQRWAKQLDIALEPYGIHRKEDFEVAFAAMARSRPEALMTTSDTFILSYRKEIVEFVVKHRFLSIFPIPELVELGGLMSYGQNVSDMYRQAAGYIDRVLKGTRPADLPVEQPTKFYMVLNLKAAKALGISIRPSILLRADRVIE